MTSATFRPFSNATEHDIWAEHNCEKCAKGWDTGNSCPLEQALLDLSGTIPRAIAERIGVEEVKTRERGKPSYEVLARRCREWVDEDAEAREERAAIQEEGK